MPVGVLVYVLNTDRHVVADLALIGCGVVVGTGRQQVLRLRQFINRRREQEVTEGAVVIERVLLPWGNPGRRRVPVADDVLVVVDAEETLDG